MWSSVGGVLCRAKAAGARVERPPGGGGHRIVVVVLLFASCEALFDAAARRRPGPPNGTAVALLVTAAAPTTNDPVDFGDVLRGVEGGGRRGKMGGSLSRRIECCHDGSFCSFCSCGENHCKFPV